MGVADYMVAGAKENPINKSFLPKENPECQFPVWVESPAKKPILATKTLALLLLCSAGSLLVPVSFVDFFAPAAIGTVIVTLIRWSVKRHGLGIWDVIRRFVLPVVGVGLGAFLLFSSGASGLLAIGTWGVLLWEAGSFRRHYVELASAGMIDKRTRDIFRKTKRLPKGLTAKSALTGFCDSVSSYLTYNAEQITAPGVFLSPAGRHSWRITKTIAVTSLLTLSIAAGFWPTGGWWTLFPTRVYPFHVLLCPLLGVTVWLIAAFVFTWSFVGGAYALRLKQVSSSHWRRMLDNMQNSKVEEERNSLWIGWVGYDRSPILYPIEQLFKHVWVVGKTGSGKTAWLLGLLDQIIYRNDISLIYIDLKAIGFEAFAAMRAATEAVELKSGVRPNIQHFTLDNGEHTHLLNIFGQRWWKKITIPQRTSVILTALGLSYATAYGQSYYRDSAYHVLHFVLKRHPNISSWHELHERLQVAIRNAKSWELSDSIKRDGEHVVMVVDRLASLASLNDYGNLPQTVRDNAIDFTEAFEKSGHYYFALASTRHQFLVGEVGRLIAGCLLIAASSFKKRRTKVILVIDEWQEMVTKDLAILLSQARALDIGVILANQNTSQLITPDCDMRGVVEANTSLQAWMHVTDSIGREQMERLGGKEVSHLISKQVRPNADPSYTFSQTIMDRVSGNLISAVCSDPQQFMLRVTDNAGYACFDDMMFAARSMFHQTKTAFIAGCNMDWLPASAETLLNDDTRPTTGPSPKTNQKAASVAAPGSHSFRSNQLGRTRSAIRNP